MNKIKVLGIGSPFGDDQLGWKVAEALKHDLSQHRDIFPFVSIESHDRPGARLIELMKGFNAVVIIDAIKSGREIGTIRRFQKEDIGEFESRFSTHENSILQALQLASALNELPNNIQFYGIEIDNIVLESILSQPVEKTIKSLVSQLKMEIIQTVKRNISSTL